VLILGNETVRSILDGREADVLALVRRCYLAHARGDTSVPHSVFLRFPQDPSNRIIALPAYVDTGHPVAGVKWIASFPGNVSAGLERASATIILNSMDTGQPEAVIEGSVISARRTAASAALAAATLTSAGPDRAVSLIGCGVINFEVLRFLRAALPGLDSVTVFDLDRRRAESFVDRCAAELADVDIAIADRIEAALGAGTLVSIATTATLPHLGLENCREGALVLHLSLRDINARAMLDAVNIVDDVDHVCRAATSLDLAARRTGQRDFIDGSLGEILAAPDVYRRHPRRVTVFSPFGLGILDLAVAAFVRSEARARGLGTGIADFLPAPVTKELARE
jgi:2,3-diaminopropionate biosynthesis protein SbnB